MTEPEQPKKRGQSRSRKYEKEGDRQKAWKKRSGFEQWESRMAYKRRWARQKRLKQKLKDLESGNEQSE